MPVYGGLADAVADAASQRVYTLENDYSAPASGSVQPALQNAVTDILTVKGGGRLLLKDRVYDFDSITWPTVGLDKPTAVIEFLGPSTLTTVGFMPGVGLTLAQGGDMPAPTKGAILRCSQVSGSGFGNIAASTNIMPVFRDVIVRTPTNPQWHGIDAGWLTNLICEGVIVDQGRSWGDGSNPLSAGPIVQPTNTGVRGIIYPGAGNGGVCRGRDILVCGFYGGLRHSEHFDGDRITLAKNIIGLEPSDGWHAARTGRMSLYWNKYDIQPIHFSAPNTRLTIDQLDTEEDPVGGNWYSTVYHINDPNNYLRGQIRHRRMVPASGPSFVLLQRGGAYLGLSPAVTSRQLVDAVGFEGADSATALPASLAGQGATQLTGTWGISSQWAYIGTVSGGLTGDMAVWETGLTQAILSTRLRLPVTVAVSNLGLALFAVDTTNWIGVFIANNNVSIQKSDAGTWTNLSGTQAVPGTMVGSQEIDLRASILGKAIRVYLDGTLRASYTLSAAEWTKYSVATRHGLMAYTAGFEPGGANGGRWGFLRVEGPGALAT